jgi:hypothetical protein
MKIKLNFTTLIQSVRKVAVHLQKVLEVMSTSSLYRPEPELN